MAAMQRNGGKLADVFDRTVQSQAIVHLGDHAQAHAMDASLFQNIPHNPALTGRGEDDLIYILRADMLEERIERADHVAANRRKARIGGRRLAGAWNFNEAHES